MITLTKGDLLKHDDVEAIINPVNCVGVMGKGIALLFKQKWPSNFSEYVLACKQGEISPGRMFVHNAGGLVRPHYIVNFPTKAHWREPSKIKFIRDGMVDLVPKVKQLKIRSLAIPALGCGNGGLDWSDVRPLIELAFAPLTDVEVRLFKPNDSPTSTTRAHE